MTTYYEILNKELESPLINAAGSINGTNPEVILREVETLADTAIGAITVGSFTIPPQEGNAAKYGEPVYYHDAESGKTYNSMGLPNIGRDEAVKLMPDIKSRANGKPVIASVSPTSNPDYPELGSSVEQATQLAYDLLDTNADFVELNVSCPNIVTEGGGRKPIMGYDLESMQELVDSLDSVIGRTAYLGVKLPPYLTDEEFETAIQLSKILDGSAFAFYVTSNTVPNQVPVDENGNHILGVPDGMGGMSGPKCKGIGRNQLLLWQNLTGFSVDIISALGVDSGKEISVRMQLGAVAASGVTFLWKSPNWKDAVTNTLADFVSEQ